MVGRRINRHSVCSRQCHCLPFGNNRVGNTREASVGGCSSIGYPSTISPSLNRSTTVVRDATGEQY